MTPVIASPQTARSTTPRVLAVDDERDLIEFVGDALSRQLDCRLATASCVAAGRQVLETEPVDLLIVDLGLPDGNGAELLKILRAKHPLASAIVITGSPTVDGAVTALREGAVDFLAKPFTGDEFVKRICGALKRQAMRVKNESRIDRLRVAVRRLNEARRLVTRKVDLLCNDLVSAYGDLSRQFDMVRATESFRGALTSADDLEQMLCHAMDWMLRQLGYANVAIWLAGEPGFQLGAYMKYSIPGDAPLIEAMRNGLVPLVAREGLIHLAAADVNKRLSADELKFMRDQTLLAAHCTYLGESLAEIILFREGGKPFTDDDVATMRSISPVFGWILATMVRQEVDDAEDPSADADGPFHDGGAVADDEPPTDKKPRKKTKDDADWWKRGEEPPF
jgi:FixJ family two-component response regulator